MTSRTPTDLSPQVPIPDDEERRLEVLHAYRVLDTAPEEAFDRITRVAADLFDVPIALVSLVDRDRQWFKSCIGLGVSETGRDASFCAHAIVADEVMVIPDALADRRFATNPLVTGEPHIRFYAGAPLKTREGASLGSLCIIDTSPRPAFSAEDQARLQTFADLVVDLLQLRIGALDLRTEVQQRERAEEEVQHQRALTELLQAVSSAANNSDSLEEASCIALQEVCLHLGWPLGQLFLLDGDRLVAGEAWHSSEPERFEVFREATRDLVLREGEGLPGRVLSEGASVFMPRPPDRARSGRVEAAVAAGIEAGAAFPILVKGEIVGVLEFYLTDPTRPDEETLQTMAQIGTQLGRVVERARARDELVRAERLAAAQAESSSRLAAIVRSSQDAIVAKDLKGTVTSWNAGAERMFGYLAFEMVGRPLQEIFPPGRRDEEPRILFEIAAGRAVENLETERVTKDGRTIQVSVSVSPVYGPTGEVIGASTINRDITRQKAAEAELRASEERARSIIDTAADAYVSMDPDGTVADWNSSAERMFGWTRAEAVGRRLSEMIIPPRYREAHESGLRRFLDTGEGPVIGQRIEIEALRRDGAEFPVELAIWPLRSVAGLSFNAFIADISQRHRAEREIRDSEAFKGAILSSIAEGVIVSDAEDRIVLINPAMEGLGGWSSDEVRGRPMTEVYVAVDQRGHPINAEHPRIGELFYDRDGVLTSRGHAVSLLKRDGLPVPVSWTLATIRDEAGDPQGRVAVLRDVTEEREVDQLKSSLVSTVSHELRTPLTMIQGFSELLLARDMGRDKSLEALNQIHVSAERLARLIDDLLSVSRIDSGSIGLDLEPLDLARLVDRVVTDFSAAGRDLIVSSEDNLPRVLVDSDRTLQVLTNLVSNAVKYSDDGPVEVRVARVEDAVRVSVTDHGIGLSQVELSQLFQKFFRADNSDVRKRPGTGLGLYITKHLVELQGGRMSVTSERGRGSTFSFTVPIAGAETDRGEER